MWYPIHAINLNILIVKGRSDLFLRVEIEKKIIGILILMIVMNFNIQIMAIGNLVSSVIALFINSKYSRKIIKYGILDQFKDVSKPFFISIISCLPAYFLLKYINYDIIILSLSCLSAISIYILISKLLRIREYNRISSFLKIKLSRKNIN